MASYIYIYIHLHGNEKHRVHSTPIGVVKAPWVYDPNIVGLKLDAQGMPAWCGAAARRAAKAALPAQAVERHAGDRTSYTLQWSIGSQTRSPKS